MNKHYLYLTPLLVRIKKYLFIIIICLAPWLAHGDHRGDPWGLPIIVSTESLADNIEIFLPPPPVTTGFEKMVKQLGLKSPKEKKFPFVMFMETSSGSDRATSSPGVYNPDNDDFYPWTQFFLDNGIAVVQIHSASARNMKNWEGDQVNTCLGYNQDPFLAYQIAIKNKKLDPKRFALLGQSMGGIQVLNTGKDFLHTPLAAIFALYPACISFDDEESKNTAEFCKINYSSNNKTAVHILYGNKDDWGNTQNSKGESTFSQCKAKADADPKDNIYFHTLKGAFHAFEGYYDVDREYTPPYVSGHNQSSVAAINATATVIAHTLSPLWKIKIDPKKVDSRSGTY